MKHEREEETENASQREGARIKIPRLTHSTAVLTFLSTSALSLETYSWNHTGAFPPTRLLSAKMSARPKLAALLMQ